MTDTTFDLDEIWALVAQEGGENLALAEQVLLKLEASPADKIETANEDIAALFRALHTFKGAVRMMGLANTEMVAHWAEDLVSLARDKAVALDAEMIDLLLQALDRLRAMLGHILAHRADVPADQTEELSARLQDMVRRKDQPGQAITPAPLPRAPGGDSPRPSGPPAGPGPEAAEEMPTPQPLEAAPQLPGCDAPAASFSGLILEPLDLGADPEYVRMFLELAREDAGRLQGALENLAAGRPDTAEADRAQARASADALQIAAERMGYSTLLAVLAEIGALVGPAEGLLPVNSAPEWHRLMRALPEELDRIQSAAGLSAPAPEPLPSAPADLLRQWSVRQVEASLDRLEAAIAGLDQEAQQLAAGKARQTTARTSELMSVLRTIYHTCVFYNLNQAAHLTLVLEDLSARLQQDEIPLSATVLGVYGTYVKLLHEAMQSVAGGQAPDLPAFEALENLAQNVICLASGSPVLQVARAVVGVLNLPGFYEVLTPENLAELSQALRAGQDCYTILANLNQSEALGATFAEWLQAGEVTHITNVTAFRDQRSLFNFLVTSAQPPEALRDALLRIDPAGTNLALTACTLPPGLKPAQLPEALVQAEPGRRPTAPADSGVGVSAAALAELADMVGELVVDQSTLHRVVTRLADTEIPERVMERARAAAGAPAGGASAERRGGLSQELEAYWANWTQSISVLAQAEVKLNATLTRLQEKTRTLGLRPAAEILEPLGRLAQVLALRLGKEVTLAWEGAEVELDQQALDILAEVLGRLVSFCVTEDLEQPEQRRTAGKPVAGHVTIRATRTGNFVQVTVDDDGCGRLAGPDLAGVQARLQARQGKLTAASRPGLGSRFTLTLPLDLAVVDGMVVRVGPVCYVVPVHAIQRIVKPEAADLIEAAADGAGSLLKAEGRVWPVRRLQARPASVTPGETPPAQLLVIVDKEPQPVALEVDELIGRQSVLVRPLPGQLAEIRSAMGCALLGEGEVGMVLNLETL